jgi:hypothetical protein
LYWRVTKYRRAGQGKTVNINYPIAGLERPLRFQEFEDPRISRQPENEGGKVVGPWHRPILPNRRYLCYSFLSDDESNPGSWCGRKD